ncbi:reverse transcriptase domain-containing protein [Tanacetum coccineum]
MSAMANVTPIIATVKEKTLKEADAVPKACILDFCEKHYEDILPIIMDRARHEKRKEVQTRLDFGESSKKIRRERGYSLNSRAGNSPIRFHHKRSRTHGQERHDDRNVFNRLSHRKKSVHERLSDTYSPSITKSGPSRASSRDPSHSRGRSLKSIDGYKGLKAAFLAYFMQQKKYVKDPVEIHNIKQRDGETIEEFMERFKIETGRMKGAPECMRISGFMHGVNNPELTKRLNEHVPKTVEEMMTATTAFIRGETAAASKKKVHTPWKSQDQSKRHTSERRSDFRNQPKDGRGSNKFTPLTRTPKEIFAAESGKFKPPPPMVTPVEKRSSNKFCEFHNDKGHNTDECVQLRKQIEELVRAGKLSHFIKEIRQDRDQQKTRKKDAPVKDKAAAIYMIQPWQRVTRQKVTQSFYRFPHTITSHHDSNKVTEGHHYRNGNWRCRAFYESMNEFYDCEVTVTVQRYHWKASDKRNPSSTIHGSRNAQVPGEWWNSDYP